MEELSDGVFDKLIKLEVLNLDNNPELKLTSNTFGRGLSNLKELSLTGCNLHKVPDNLFKNFGWVFCWKSLSKKSLILLLTTIFSETVLQFNFLHKNKHELNFQEKVTNQTVQIYPTQTPKTFILCLG